MTSYQVKRLSVLVIFYCLIRVDGSTSSTPNNGNNVYSPIIQSICNSSDDIEDCIDCLGGVINKKVISLTEIGADVVDKLETCLEDASKGFHEFQCELYKKASYKFEDYLEADCVQSLQTKNPSLDLGVNLNKIKSNLGYFNLTEVVVTTLMGILKYAKDKRDNTADKPQPAENTEMCSLVENSRFLYSLSQVAGQSWTQDFEKRAPSFFTTIHERVCDGNRKCFQCLQDLLNTETITPKEASPDIFLKLLKCKTRIPTKVSSYLQSIKQRFNLQAQLPKSCIYYLTRHFWNFRFDYNLNMNDLVEDTFYIQELIKFGIGTVFFYFHDTQRVVSDDMRLGICQTVILRYTRTFKYAMRTLTKDYGFVGDTSSRSNSPYMKMFDLVCKYNNYCKGCYQKVAYSVNVKQPDEISETLNKVLDHCEAQQFEEFKDFSPTTTFKSCIKTPGALEELFDGYPLNDKTNAWTASTRPKFSKYRKFLNFVYKGLCYYYRGDKEPYHNHRLAYRLYLTGMPGAYLYVIPGLNKRSIRGKSSCGEAKFR